MSVLTPPIAAFACTKVDERKLVANFDVIAQAAGSEGKLRKLVLSLSMRGQLTQQVRTDGHAVDLLATMAAGNTASGKPTSAEQVLDHSSGPFPLPRSWCWARFDRVASIASYLVDPSKFQNYPHVAPDNIEKATGRLLECRTIREDGVTSSKHRFFPGQIVYSKIRPNLSKAALVDFEGLCSADMYPLTAKIDRGFLHLYLLSPPFLEQVVRDDNRLAMPKVNQEQLAAVLVAVPPIAEQQRIVAKVGQLMGLCDDLAARQAKKREVGIRLTKSALHALTTAESAAEFDVAWKRIVDNFNALVDQADKLDELRGAVMSLALRGGLSSTDGRGSALADLGGHRELVAEGHHPYPLPNGWAWLYMDQVFASITDGDHQPPPKVADGVPFLTIGNVSGGRLDFSETRFVSREYFDGLDPRRVPARGDILYTVVGSYGIPVAVEDDREFCVQRHIAILRPDGACDPEYLFLFLNSPVAYRQATAAVTGTAQPTVPLRPLRRFMVPVPPRAEQTRIVAKVKSLIKLCDELEARLRGAEDLAARMAEAVLHELVA